MPDTLIKVNLNEAPEKQDVLHNRWHPDIPMVATVEPGEEFRVQCVDWTGGQVANTDDAADIKYVDLTKVHYLSGPIGVKGAEPGDLLVVDILDVGMLEDSYWGFTGIFAKENGGSFLVDQFPEARKACWDYHGIKTTSRHIPGVEFDGIRHPGLIGTLPSKEILAEWNKREKKLYDTNPDRVPALATLPYADTAHMGRMEAGAAKEAAMEAARTVPPREHGGNCDIKDLSRGSKVYFPVYVKDGGLSMGDCHFSQGDGEITFCGGIETAAYVDCRVDLIKNGVELYGVKNPIFEPSPSNPNYADYIIFEGISVDETGEQHYMDATVAYRQACLNCIEYFKKFGYTGEQIYALLSSAPVQGHISGIVDIPNACATLFVPTQIFDFDVKPSKSGPKQVVPQGIDVAKALS